MPSASFLFLLFLYLRKFTYGNILETGRKFMENFYSTEGTRRPKGSLGAMASLIDSLGGEVEEEPAELVAVSPGLGAAGVGGDVRRPWRTGARAEGS